MKSGIIISVLTAIIVYLVISNDYIIKSIGVVLALISLMFLFFKQSMVYHYYKSQISNFKEGVSAPFVNVNKVSWKVLTLIPTIDKMTAKHIIHNRRHLGNYKNFDDFFKINEITEEKRERIKKYIVI